MDEEDETHKRFAAQLSMTAAILEYFAELEGIKLSIFTESPERKFFRDKIIPAINSFARTPEEAAKLAADAFCWEAGSIARYMGKALQTQEIHQPDKVFNAPDAMSDVP